MNDDVKPVIEALQDAIDAAREEKEARDKLGSCYSWDYYGHDFIAKRDAAAERFGNTLEELILAKIERILDQRL